MRPDGARAETRITEPCAIALINQDGESQLSFNRGQFLVRLDDQEVGQLGEVEVIA
jgi:hypothetical protein